jgi:hypothetical protein
MKKYPGTDASANSVMWSCVCVSPECVSVRGHTCVSMSVHMCLHMCVSFISVCVCFVSVCVCVFVCVCAWVCVCVHV